MRSLVLILLLSPTLVFASPATQLVAGGAAGYIAQPVRVELIRGGYRVYLDQRSADRLHETLSKVRDEESLSLLVREVSKNEMLDEDMKVQLEFLAWSLAKQLPAFKKALEEKRGEHGVVLTVYGLQKEPRNARPILRRVARGIMQTLPADLEEKANKAIVVARTGVVYWTLEPR